jgi:D-cysteine desulfhydrase
VTPPTAPARLRLAHLPTPITPLPRLSAEMGASIDVKRDDLTGLATSGNKIRKLEFVLAEARARGATALVTCGGIQSNHARATAAAAARLGLRAVLLLAGEPGAGAPEGNLLLDRLLGAEVRFVSPAGYAERDARMAEIARDLRAAGETPFVIPEGASDALGAWGYVAAVGEILTQAPEFPWDTVVCAVGSGGTLAGLVLGARLHGLTARVRGYSVHRTPAWFAARTREIVDDFAARYACRAAVREPEIEVIGGYEGPAYAETYPEELETIRRAARLEGIVLDPVYTAKAFTGLLADIRADRIARGARVLFIHTGGIFGLFAQREGIL